MDRLVIAMDILELLAWVLTLISLFTLHKRRCFTKYFYRIVAVLAIFFFFVPLTIYYPVMDYWTFAFIGSAIHVFACWYSSKLEG